LKSWLSPLFRIRLKSLRGWVGLRFLFARQKESFAKKKLFYGVSEQLRKNLSKNKHILKKHELHGPFKHKKISQ